MDKKRFIEKGTYKTPKVKPKLEDEVLDDKDEPDEFNTKEFREDADIIQNMVEVENRKRFSLDENYTKSAICEDEKAKEFIRKQHLVATKIYNLIPDKTYAEKARRLIMQELDDLAILNRNTRKNVILIGILQRGNGAGTTSIDQMPAKPEDKSLIGKAKGKVRQLIGGD